MEELILKGLSSDAAEIARLKDSGAIKIDPNALPARMNFSPGEKTMVNTLRGLLKESENTELQDLGEADLVNMVLSLRTPDKSVDIDGLKIPHLFGTSDLDTKDYDSLRSFRKDCRESVSIDIILNFLADYHEKQRCKFSEMALIDALNTILPSKALSTYHKLRLSGAKIASIFQELCIEFGEARSKDDILNELHVLFEANKPALEIFQEVNALLDSARSDFTGLDELVLNEARRYVRNNLGSHILATVESLLKSSSNKTYRGFFKILKTHFNKELTAKKTKAHHIGEQTETLLNDETKALLNQLITASSDSHSLNMHNVMAQKKCYSCQETGHLIKNCPKKSKNNSQGNPNSYCNQKCNYHPNSNHSNFQCRLQTGPCTGGANHSSHSLGQCRRPVGGTQPLGTAQPLGATQPLGAPQPLGAVSSTPSQDKQVKVNNIIACFAEAMREALQ